MLNVHRNHTDYQRRGHPIVQIGNTVLNVRRNHTDYQRRGHPIVQFGNVAVCIGVLEITVQRLV